MKKVTFVALAALTITACSSGPEFPGERETYQGPTGKCFYLEASGLEGIVPLDSVKLKGKVHLSFKQPRPESPEFYRVCGWTTKSSIFLWILSKRFRSTLHMLISLPPTR